MAPLEPHEKVLVSEKFLGTIHGSLDCESCHSGNPALSSKAEAHQGLVPHPSINNPEGTCGSCHPDIVATAKDSLHATLSTFPTILKTRADMNRWDEIDKARAGHCAACHTSCGGCHVSRPKFAKKGFVSGHVFNKHPDPVNQCTACHGSRVGMEYYGSRGQGDIHASKGNMDCVACHGATEMHAAAPPGLPGRYHLTEMPDCEDCHQDLEYGSVREHGIHKGKVQCQVCHSQTYVNCYSCHVGRDGQNIAYFQNKLEVEEMKIGLKYDVNEPGASFKYMLVRHEPTDPEVFDFYLKNAFKNFDRTPTWKRASPHNIQRKTWQNASCNNCHGNRELFLSEGDLLDYERTANVRVVVSDKDVPTKRDKVRPTVVSTDRVKRDMVVNATWLHEHKGKKGLVLLDARDEGAYEKGHIEGAVNLDPLAEDLRHSWEAERPMQVVPFESLEEIFGEFGVSARDHIVVYDKDGSVAGFLLWLLQYAGASDVAYLDGGIEAWEAAGYHLSTEDPDTAEKNFDGEERPEFMADNAFVQASLDKSSVVIMDSRMITQSKGVIKHGQAARAGHIPGSVNVPLGTLIMDNGYLKRPEELLWVLANYGITPDKTVVTTCNTGQLAADAFFVLRYLGFEDVRVHDESWIGWSALK